MVRPIVLAALSAAAFAGSAHANPVSNGIHYMSSTTATCNGSHQCTASFPSVPANGDGKPVVVREIGCTISISNNSTVRRTMVAQHSGGNWWSFRAYPKSELITTTTIKRYTFQESLHYYVSSGNTPLVLIEATPAPAQFSVDCTLYGNRM